MEAGVNCMAFGSCCAEVVREQGLSEQATPVGRLVAMVTAAEKPLLGRMLNETGGAAAPATVETDCGETEKEKSGAGATDVTVMVAVAIWVAAPEVAVKVRL